MAGQGGVYHANIGGDRPSRPGEWPSPIGVMLQPDGMPRGQAFEVGATADGVALWRLVVGGAEVPGRFVLRGRRFVQVR